MKWVERLQKGLAKTRQTVQKSLRRLGRGHLDPVALEDVESSLLEADVGIHTVERFLEMLKDKTRVFSGTDPTAVLHTLLTDILRKGESEPLEQLIRRGPRPFVILIIGINGVGKTTTIAKLGHRLKQQGLHTLFVAGDTFRAAAIEQLDIWGKRTGIDVIKQKQGSDPAAVVFDGMVAAKARNVDVVLIDTAGRLHTKINLMDELKKIKRIIAREMPDAPHETLLVLDGTLGQNAIAQARQFHESLGVTGLALTKLDGTSKGGVVVAIVDELNLPIRLIGVGEGEADLQDFQASAFVEALLPTEDSEA
ncbi:signal recognition particle-docking protein FtsY [Nitrospira sp. T9]|uniref:signal recognition particle-docking protein FtsY n=1 Tax=unclassified Nitrospira TaxID=2652172 RepID=UPI003F9DAE28